MTSKEILNRTVDDRKDAWKIFTELLRESSFINESLKFSRLFDFPLSGILKTLIPKALETTPRKAEGFFIYNYRKGYVIGGDTYFFDLNLTFSKIQNKENIHLLDIVFRPIQSTFTFEKDDLLKTETLATSRNPANARKRYLEAEKSDGRFATKGKSGRGLGARDDKAKVGFKRRPKKLSVSKKKPKKFW